jgi:hypothetical protein
MSNDEAGAPVTMVSLKADLLNAQARLPGLQVTTSNWNGSCLNC